MNNIGVHALSWIGGWTDGGAKSAVAGSAEHGYDLDEIRAFARAHIHVAGNVDKLARMSGFGEGFDG